MLDRLDDDYGVDTIEMGATIGVAMEAGVAAFGDAQAAINLVHEVGKGTPLGRILGNGGCRNRQSVWSGKSPCRQESGASSVRPTLVSRESE